MQELYNKQVLGDMELTGQEYFGQEEHDQDIQNIASNKIGYKIIAKFEGAWHDELDTAINQAKKTLYTNRGEHNDYLYITKINDSMPKFNSMMSLLGFESCTSKQIQMQRPGSLLARHRDPTVNIKDPDDPDIQLLITLAHWEWGQFLFFNDSVVKCWKPGEVIYADFINTMHCTCNCSSHTRPLLQVRGRPGPELKNLIKSNEVLTIKI